MIDPETQLRLECLRLAAGAASGGGIVRLAQELHEFATGAKIPVAPKVRTSGRVMIDPIPDFHPTTTPLDREQV